MFLKRYCLLGVLLWHFGSITSASSETAGLHSRTQTLDVIDKLLKDYGTDIRPSGPADGSSDATTTSVNMYIRSIEDLNDKNMEWKIQVTFRMQWRDERLKFNTSDPYLTIPQSRIKKLWKPDLFFSNERNMRFHNALAPNEYMRIFPDGEILHSIRLSLTLSCPMILRLFPFDKQTCSLRCASYGFTTKDLIFKWKPVDPVQVTRDLHLPSHFSLEQFTTDYCDSQTNTGVYSCLRVDLLFRREIPTYIENHFVPMILSIVAAWLSFWLHPTKSAMPRALLLAGSVAYLKVSSFNESNSLVTYATMADQWNRGCCVFIVLSIIEFVFVSFLANSRDDDRISERERDERLHLEDKPTKAFQLPVIVDLYFRILYPIAFGLFAGAYFFMTLPVNEDGDESF